MDLSQQAYLTRAGTLAPLSGRPDFRNGTVRFFTRLPDGRYLRFVDGFTLGKQTCPFTSLVDEAGTYYGSVEVSSYSTTMADRVYVNQRGQLMVSRKLEARRTCTTLRLDPLTKAGSGDWVYGAMPHEGNLIVGGTGASAPVYRIDPDGAAVVLAQKTPFGVDVSEYYSYLHYGRNLLIGTYPAGDPAVVGKSRSIRLDTSLFPAGRSDYLDRSGDPRRYKRYRELQALASTSGYLLGGMYPWGEVLGVDSLTKRRWRTRVFSHPKRTATRAPYYLEARRQERGFNRGAYDHIEELGKLHRDRVRTGTTDETPRIHGLFQDAWGQRVSQMVVLSGRVCASTGSMGDSNFIPQVHTPLTPEKFAEYGRILCAPLDRQVLAGVERPGRLRVTVDILADGIQLQTDGQPHARLGMDNGELLSSLRHGYTEGQRPGAGCRRGSVGVDHRP